MKIEFSELAVFELIDAESYYELQQTGLGKIFKNYIKEHLEILPRNPLAFPKVSRNIRKFTLTKFPVKIYYSILEDRIIIVSLRHQSKKPGDWDKRK